MREIKQFRTTCQSCGNETFRPFVNFKPDPTPGKKATGCLGDTFLVTASSAACLPLGCCMGGEVLRHRANKMKTPMEIRKKNYCEAHKCKKCGGTDLVIETISDYVE